MKKLLLILLLCIPFIGIGNSMGLINPIGQSHWKYGSGIGSQSHWKYGSGIGSQSHWKYGSGYGSQSHWKYGSGIGSQSHWKYGSGIGSQSHWKYGSGERSKSHWKYGSGEGSKSHWKYGSGITFDQNNLIDVYLGLFQNGEEIPENFQEFIYSICPNINEIIMDLN